MPACFRSEQPFLLLQIADRPDIRDRKRNEILILVSSAEIEAADLKAQAAAICVVRHLGDAEIHARKANVVYRLERRIPSLPIWIAIANCETELVLRPRDDRVGPDLSGSNRYEVAFDANISLERVVYEGVPGRIVIRQPRKRDPVARADAKIRDDR